MTAYEFEKLMQCNEPDFRYHGQEYSVCSPNGKYYVTASDDSSASDLEFDTLDGLLEHWIVQGRRFRDILPDIEII